MSSKKVLVYGGKGALGSVCVNYFKSKNWWVGSVDATSQEKADANIVVRLDATWVEQQNAILEGIAQWLPGGDDKLDAIVCVAGGWAGGNAASKDFIKNADLMWKQSVWTSAIASRVAAKYLKSSGLLALTGAQPALKGTPGMLGYGMAKAAVHQLTKSLACSDSGLPSNATTLAIVPIMLDTPMNRKFMPDADKSTWTPLEFVAMTLNSWADDVDGRPPSGTLVQLVTEGGQNKLVNVE